MLVFVLLRTAGLAALGLLAAAGPSSAGGPPVLAVVAFDYSDSSGEPVDQSAEHEARVTRFRVELRDRLSGGGHFKTVELPCLAAAGCSAATTPPDVLLDEAKRAGADLLTFGRIHKMSTLVGWGRVDVLDVASGKLVFDRVLSFRGDNDEAFDRAADFAARDIARTLSPNEAAAIAAGRGIR